MFGEEMTNEKNLKRRNGRNETAPKTDGQCTGDHETYTITRNKLYISKDKEKWKELVLATKSLSGL